MYRVIVNLHPSLNDLNPQFMPEYVDISVLESLYASEMPTKFK
jgi:hypothetical protein